jgi:hypothetical protein
MSYLVKRALETPDISAPFDAPCWADAEVMKIDRKYREGSNYNPEVNFKLKYDNEGLYGLFEARDSHVRCANTGFQSSVCHDSCLEFFVRPAAGVGYQNFEINASGAMLCMHISNPGRTANGFIEYRFLTEEEVKDIRIFHTLPDKVEPEMEGEQTYRLGWFIPFSLFKHLNGAPVPVKGTVWRANVYKCGDCTSHPHWQSWTPLRAINFHVPDEFGKLVFD